MPSQLQMVIASEIGKKLDNALFSCKVKLINRDSNQDSYDLGYLNALNDLEEEIENIIRFFELHDVLKHYGSGVKR